MKTTVTVLFLLIFAHSHSQNLTKRIDATENGLLFPAIFSGNQKVQKFNILTLLDKYKIHGASVAVINNGKIDWTKTYGFVDANHTEKVTKETLFQSASIGKIITALVALKLVEEGKLDLDEDINNQLKSWKLTTNKITEKNPVTLRHLLSHSSGLTDDYGFLGYPPHKEIPSILQILNRQSPSKNTKALVVKTIPGKVERYSGGGYLIAQLLIEENSGMSFENCVQKYIFDPLEMTNSTYNYHPDKTSNSSIANGHKSNGKALKKKKYHIYPEKAAAGPWTTAEDLGRLIIGIQNNAVLTSETSKQMLSPQINQKGLGLNLKGIEKPTAFWHAGQNLGYTGLLYGLIENGKGAVILLNSDGGENLMQEFISSVAMAYNWPVMQSYKALNISSKEKENILGSYKNKEQSIQLNIIDKRGILYLNPANSKEKAQLFKIGENHYTFKDAQDYCHISFQIKDEKIARLVYQESIGNTIILNKL